MLTVERTFDVEPSPARIFAYLADFTSTNAWDPGTVETTRLPDTGDQTGTIGLGNRYRNISEFRGRRTELAYELTTYEPDRHLVFTGQNKTVTSADDLTLSPTASGGTTIHYQARFDFHGLARLAEPFLKKTFDTVAEDTVARMRTVLNGLDTG